MDVIKMEGWISNPYRTIFEFIQLGVTVKGQIVIDALNELESMMGETDNEVAKERITYVKQMFKDIIADGLLDNETPMAQSIILIKLQIRLHEEFSNIDDATVGNSGSIARN